MTTQAMEFIHTGILISVFFIDKFIFLFRKSWLNFHQYADTVTGFDQNAIHNLARSITMPNQQDTLKSSTQLAPTVELSINGISSNEQNQSFIDKFKSIFVTVQFTRLNIDCKNISTGMLVVCSYAISLFNVLCTYELEL
jgi:hypothetical protein